MRLHLLSDLHLEFADYQPAVTDADVTVLAGDIAPKLRGLHWALEHFPGTVLYVPGNHEYYGWEFDKGLRKLRAEAETADGRLRVMDRELLVINGVRFLAATAWTDFALFGNAPEASYYAQERMTDYKRIRVAKGGYRRLRAIDTMREAQESRLWLQRQLEQPHDGPTVVVTHHAPSQQSLLYPDADYQADPMAPAFASSWEPLMAGVDLWLHGHTHLGMDYRVGACRVVSNPRGYPGEDVGFDPRLTIEVPTSSKGLPAVPDRATVLVQAKETD